MLDCIFSPARSIVQLFSQFVGTSRPRQSAQGVVAWKHLGV